MTKSAVPSSSNPAGDPPEAGASPAVDSLEDQVIRTWHTSRGTVIGAVAVVVLAFAGYYGWQWLQAGRDADTTRQFGAADTATELRAFVASHAGHPLAGLAQLRIADEAYEAGQFAEAVTAYDQAAAALASGPFAGRAKLGSALAKLASGQAAAAEPQLKLIFADTNLPLNIRTEAGYNLVSLAADARRDMDVLRLSEEVLQLDPGSPWGQRALMLRAKFAVPAPVPAAPAAPSAPGPAAAPAPAPAGGVPPVPVFP